MLNTETTKDENTSSSPLLAPCRFFSYGELSRATNNFDEKWCIGRGGFGKVYRGLISDSGSINTYAVKRLHIMSDQGAPEFWVEVNMLSRLRHCNLVSLIGYCNERKKMSLVYEYMQEGTLSEHLHKKGTLLRWSQRLKICLGAARGLDYLHTGTGTQHGIIHRDVKSSNILLDQNFAAKIADFGLAKTGPINQTLTHVSTVVKGTFGYMDPHYFYTGRLTRKSDVYAFGVVLVEVLCGRPALDESLDEGLAMWAQDRIKEGKLSQIIDSRLRDNHISKSSIKVFSRIAVKCLVNNPNQRPTMSEVVSSLDLALSFQERKSSSTQGGNMIIKKVWSIFSLKSHFESKETNGGRPISETVSIPDPTIINEVEVEVEERKPLEELHSDDDDDDDDDDDGHGHGDDDDDDDDPLPEIGSLEIIGDTFPGGVLHACGYAVKGAVSCTFQWVQHLSDGSIQYIEGASESAYTVALCDVGTYLGVEVVPIDRHGRQGTCSKYFTNIGK